MNLTGINNILNNSLIKFLNYKWRGEIYIKVTVKQQKKKVQARLYWYNN